MTTTKIEHVTLYDGKGGKVENTAIVFDESQIIALGDDALSIEAEVVIDGTGLSCLPGFMDLHVHLGMDGVADPFTQVLGDAEADGAYRSLNNAQKQLASGVVTVRNVGSKYNTDIALRNAINSGLVKGPRIYASGEPIVMTGGHGHPIAIEADGPDEVRKAARKQLKAGADLLKLMATGGVMTPGVDPGSPQLSELEMRAACEEATHVNKRTAAHAQGCEGIKNAVRAGITTVEHGMYLDDEAIELMLKHDTFLVPTLAAPYYICKNGLAGGIPEYAVIKAERTMEVHRESFRKAYQAGVKIATGTDAGTPFNLHGDFATELELMAEEQVPVQEIIAAATSVAAAAIGIEEVTGTLEKGKWADLILIDGDPEKDVKAFRRIKQVYKGGVLM